MSLGIFRCGISRFSDLIADCDYRRRAIISEDIYPGGVVPSMLASFYRNRCRFIEFSNRI
jgi:hypothetical protein